MKTGVEIGNEEIGGNAVKTIGIRFFLKLAWLGRYLKIS
jgi:hypothetical protein